MIKVNCETCSAPYEVDPRRIPAGGLKMRCPACGASVHVRPDGGSSGGEADLPAPKSGGGAKFKGTQLGMGALDVGAAVAAAKQDRQNLSDLPAPKPAAQRIAAPIPDNDFADLPAPKANAPKMASSAAANDFADLPAPKSGGGGARLAPAFDEIDLPAAKPAGGFQRPGGAVVNPAPAVAQPVRQSMPKDSLAMDPEPFFAGMKAAGALGDLDDVAGGEAVPSLELGDIDLPQPKARALGGFDAPPRGLNVPKPQALDAGGELPAAKKPPPPATMLGIGLGGAAGKLPKDSLDLPSALARGADLKGFTLGDDSAATDLPAPKSAAKARDVGAMDLPAHADLPVRKPAAKPIGDLDLPAPADLPAPKSAAKARDFGDLDLPAHADLPAPKPAGASALGGLDLPSHADLPAPKPAGARARDLGDLDLPAPADLPALKPEGARGLGGLDLPAPADLPAPKPAGALRGSGLGNLDLPAPADLPTLKTGGSRFGEIDLPAHADLPAVHQGESAFAGLPAPADLPALHRGESHVGLPAPADLPALHRGESAYVGLPAPADLPILKDDFSDEPTGNVELPLGGPALGGKLGASDGSTAMGIGPMASQRGKGAVNVPSGTEMGIGGGAAANFDFGDDLHLPPTDGGPSDFSQTGGLPIDFGASTGGSFGSTQGGFEQSLELPPPGGSALIDFSKLGMPSDGHASAHGGTLELDELELPGDNRGGSAVLPLPSLGDRQSMVGGGAPRGQTIELDFEPNSSMAIDFGNSENSGVLSSATFGDLDFGLGNAPAPAAPAPAPMPQPIPQNQNMRAGGFDTSSVEDELLGNAEGTIAAPVAKKKKVVAKGISLPGWALALIFVVVIAATGVSLGLFTPYGYFGVYLVEQALPAAGDPVKVAAAIRQAEKQSLSDTYVDTRKALATLSEARNEAGLNRELLARSLLHEALYQLRFGDDPQSAQRSVALLARVMERGADVRGLTLARAADAARANRLKDANALMKQVRDERDVYTALVAGEIAMLNKKYDEAKRNFDRAMKMNGGARAAWGYARALLAAGEVAKAEEAAHETLKTSPRHSAALTLLARGELSKGNTDKALMLTRQATGWIAVDSIRARPARHDRVEAWALEGKIQEQLDRTREALDAYEQALKVDPLRTDILLGSGRMLMRMGRARDALSRFDSAVGSKSAGKSDEEKKAALIEGTNGAVEALLAQKRAPEARARVEPVLSQHPEEASLHLSLGHSFEALEKYDEAEAQFRATIEKAPTSFGGYVGLSQLLFKRNRPEEAARILSEATAKVADGPEVRRMLGQSEMNRNHLPEAIHHFKQALAFDPRDSASMFGLVTAQRKSGLLTESQNTLERLAKLDATHPGIPLERGKLLEARGDYQAAADAYRAALKDRPTDTDLKLRLGAALVTAEKIDEADAILQEVLKDRPNSAEAEHYIGRVLFARKDTAQAVQRFERAVNFEPNRAEYHLYLAWGSLDQGNLSGALASVQKALQLDPQLADGYWILGRIQLRTGAVQDALENLSRAHKLKPGRTEALADMGSAYDQLRKLDDAVKSYEQAVKAQPQNGEWWFQLGDLELDRGHRTQARVALSEAVLRGDRLFDKPMWVADAHRLYAEMLREDNRWAEAAEHYRLYLQISPSNARDRHEIEQILKSMDR